MALPRINLASLDRASRDPVIDALFALAGTPVDTWLPNAHPASRGQFLNAQGRAFVDFSAFKSRFSGQQISEVLAATSPNHCMDGWTFLSRALAALLAGDTHTTRHLAYYAQLRAGLCILGCNGIGIFNTINFAVDSSLAVHRLDTGRLRRRGLGTHAAVWAALELWASRPTSAKVFLESVKFRGISLWDCIDAIWPSSGSAPLVEATIRAWGVDLMRSDIERESRNISSYSAHAFNPTISSLPHRLELVRDIWLCLEPDGLGGFPSLDRHLLRKFLELMRSRNSRSLRRRKFWSRNFPNLDPNIQQFAALDFLAGADDPNDLVVFNHANSGPPGDVHAMICRALLLLRIATSVVHTAFVDAGFEPLADKVPPSFEQVGDARGFWAHGQMPNDLMDLWTVVDVAVSDLAASISSNPADQHGFLDSFPGHASFLSQTERACMWALCA